MGQPCPTSLALAGSLGRAPPILGEGTVEEKRQKGGQKDISLTFRKARGQEAEV